MGNFNATDNKTNPYADFQLVSTETVPALGTFEVYEDRRSPKFYLVYESNYAIPNPEMAESGVQSLKKIETIRNACRLVTQTVGKSKVLCFDNYSINLCFEYYPTSMAAAIKARVPGTKIPESEIWAVIEDLVQYLVDLRNLDLHHLDLQPKNILFNKNKIVKVLCPLLYTTYESAYRLRLANEGYHAAFSPEEMEAYDMRVPSVNGDPMKMDVFSLGICLLCYARGVNFETFYNYQSNKVDLENVRKEIAKLISEDAMSEELFFFVNMCTKSSPAERADLEFLWKVIAKRQQKTKNREKDLW